MAYVYGTDFDDYLDGTGQNDNMYGFNGDDTLWGYNGNDYIDGGNGNDYIDSGEGNDILRGWSGADGMNGDHGNDTYFVEDVGDQVIEFFNAGTDTVNSKLTNYILPGDVENLTLTGTEKINGTGNSGNNTITGNSGTNQLNGGAGNDILDGKGSFDKLTGGTGNDIFRFTVKGPADLISDFNVANDTIQLENSVFTKLSTGTLSSSQFRVGTHALDSNDYIVYNKPTGALSYDADGSGGAAATLIANVNDGLNVTNADIFVI